MIQWCFDRCVGSRHYCPHIRRDPWRRQPWIQSVAQSRQCRTQCSIHWCEKWSGLEVYCRKMSQSSADCAVDRCRHWWSHSCMLSRVGKFNCRYFSIKSRNPQTDEGILNETEMCNFVGIKEDATVPFSSTLPGTSYCHYTSTPEALSVQMATVCSDYQRRKLRGYSYLQL